MKATPIATTSALTGAACHGFVWRRGNDTYLGVVVKACFRLVPGGVMQLADPPPIREVSDGAYPHDLVPYRPQADVVVRASALSANKSSVHLRMDHGREILIDKRVAFDPALSMEAPLLPTHPTPTFERSVAEAVDWSSFNCAPLDQRTRFLRGGETIRLAGVHPLMEVVAFQLENLRGQAYLAETDADAWAPLPMSCDLLCVDLAAYTAELSWRGAVQVHSGKPLERTHVLGTLADRAVELPPVPRKKRLPKALPAHLAGIRVDGGTASLHGALPQPHAGAPFELEVSGVAHDNAKLPGTPWAAPWPEPPGPPRKPNDD